MLYFLGEAATTYQLHHFVMLALYDEHSDMPCDTNPSADALHGVT